MSEQTKPVVTTEEKMCSKKEVFGHAMGALGHDAIYSMWSSWITPFFTDVLITFMGILFTVARIWDKQLIIDYLKKWEKGKKADFDKLLLDKLPDSMTEKQKKDKVRNLLAALRTTGEIKTDSPNHQIPNWILNK